MSQKQLIRIAHSPDSDDAFMFYALAKERIDTNPFQFEHILSDIQTLNQKALDGIYEVSAISMHAFPQVAHRYALLKSGASMGDGEAHPAIIRLLRRDAVEPDGPLAGPLDRRAPDGDPVALAAQLRPDDVAAEEREPLVVADQRDRGRWLPVEPAQQEPLGIRGQEGLGVAEARVPALGRRPVEDQSDLVERTGDVDAKR